MTRPYTGDDALRVLKETEGLATLLAQAAALSGGRETFFTLAQAIGDGMSAIWAREGSLIVTNIARYPTGARWLNVIVGTGKMEPLKEMMADIEAYAKLHGFAGIQSQARTGWARIGKSMGYRMTHVFLEKAIGDDE